MAQARRGKNQKARPLSATKEPVGLTDYQSSF